MLRKKENELSFADMAMEHTREKWEKHYLNAILKLIYWQSIEELLKDLYSKDEGRPAWDPVVLFRCLLLAEWNGLSDRALEEALTFRLDFRKFAGLLMEEEAPDSTTFVVFRNRIEPLWRKLLEKVNYQIKKAGYEVNKAVAVDATLVEAHSKPKRSKDPDDSDGASSGGDPEASWRGFPTKKVKDEDGNETVARKPALYGYKINLAADIQHGFVSAVTVRPANEHETHEMMNLIKKETEEVYADKGYVGNRKKIIKRKIKDGIQSKATRGHPLKKRDIERNKRITGKRRIVETVFGGWKQWYGWKKTVYLGLMRNQLAVCLTAIAWNMKKLAMLER